MIFLPSIQALRERRAAGRSSSHSPTEMLEQMQERLHSIVQDMYILNLWGTNCALYLGACSEGCAEEKAQ